MGTLARGRTLTALLLAIGALALGLIAQGYFADLSGPADGLLAYAVAAITFVIAARRTPFVASRLSPGASRPWERGVPRLDARRLAWSIALLLLSAVATIVSLSFFADDVHPSLRWLLHLAAIALFAAASYGLEPATRGQGRSLGGASSQDRVAAGRTSLGSRRALSDRSFSRLDAGLLLVILLVGLFFRLYRFSELPYGLWYDESDNGLWARQVLADPSFRPVYVVSTNLPAHFLYLVALAFRLLGDSMHAIRAVAVVFGMLTIVAAYFCGRELFGRYLGLALAFLVAVSRWDVNWSRIGMHGATVPFFELWIVAALLRGLRTGRRPPYAWAGVALGLGLCFYSPIRVFPAVLLGFTLAWLAGWLGRSWRSHADWPAAKHLQVALSAWAIPLLLVVTGTLIVVAPVAQFAIRQPDVFWDRTKRISVFRDPSVQASPATAVLDNTARHLLMFNYRGDPNGRHNLPGAPMLGRVGGVLFVLGGVLCVIRWRDPRSVLLLLWVLIPLSGGILSTWFEAPQSLRSIGSLPAVYALICLTMEWFADEWHRVFPRRGSHGRLASVAALILLAIGLENGLTYFYVWARDFASWAAFNPAETRLAQDINLYGNSYELRFDPLLTAHLTTRYLAPDYQVYHHFDPATVFPIRGTAKEGVLLFSAPDTRAFREQTTRLYPLARVESFVHPESGNAVLYKHFVSQDAIAGWQGLDALYVPLRGAGEGGSDAAGFRRVDAEIDFAWGNSPTGSYPSHATWTGGLLAPEYGTYVLRVEVPGDFVLELDDQPVVRGSGPQERWAVVAQGVHKLHLDCRVSGPGAVRLLWATPSDPVMRPVPHDALYRAAWPVRGLLGRFYPNDSWSGDPKIARLDGQIAYYFHFLPLSRPYTVEWTGGLAAPTSGPYLFSVSAVTSASLYVDGQPLVQDSPSGQTKEGSITLSAGMHDIRVRYLDNTPHSQIYLYWQPPDEEHRLIPLDALFLPRDGAWWPAP